MLEFSLVVTDAPGIVVVLDVLEGVGEFGSNVALHHREMTAHVEDSVENPDIHRADLVVPPMDHEEGTAQMRSVLRPVEPLRGEPPDRGQPLAVGELALERPHLPLVPPRRLSFVGAGDFTAIGLEFLRYFQDLGELRPTDHVLDVGCGIGRMALPLTGYLSREHGRYEGFDVVRHGIAWCQNNVTPRFPNFRFQHADIFNREYNSRGRIAGVDFEFPFPAQSFDFVILTSVFTHMLPDEANHYIAEISRVLKPGGRCFATWFLLNDESERLIDAGRSSIRLPYRLDGCRVASLAVPEDAIAHPETDVIASYRGNDLDVRRPLSYGSWCGRSNYISFQDIAITTKVVHQ